MIVAQRTGVLCKGCGKGIEIDDEYIPGIRAAQMAAGLYGHFYKHFLKSARQGVIDSDKKPWQKTLTCATPGCGKPHTYTTEDLRLYDD